MLASWPAGSRRMAILDVPGLQRLTRPRMTNFFRSYADRGDQFFSWEPAWLFNTPMRPPFYRPYGETSAHGRTGVPERVSTTFAI